MKVLSIALLMGAAIVAVAQGDAGFPEMADLIDNAQTLEKGNLRRILADGSGAGPTPTPTTRAPTPAPSPQPSPSPSPSPSPQPNPSPSPNPTPATPGTPSPTPGPATPSPGPATPTTTPSPGSSPPTPTKTPSSGAGGSSTTNEPATVAPGGSDTSGSKGSNSTSKSSKTPSPTSGSGSGDTSKEGSDSKMSGGTIAAIVGGIVAGVAILACVTMVLIRRKREHDDDPLSPFEMSMDKGYAGAAAGGNAYGSSAPGFAGAAGAQRNAPARTQELELTDTPPAGAVAAGVAYSQFYDQATSPGSVHRQLSNDHEEAAAPVSNATNLWMSAMEVHANENDSYLSAKEAQENESLDSSRNSYDLGYNNDDQSSQISGASDLNSAKDFPDYEDESARGSYEL